MSCTFTENSARYEGKSVTVNAPPKGLTIQYVTSNFSVVRGRANLIWVGANSADTARVNLENDNFSGGSGIVNNQNDEPVDATPNWWGSAAGPNTPGAGTTRGLVKYRPWLLAPPSV